VVLIDVRNTFEHAIGHFVHPHLTNDANDGGISLEDEDNNIDGNKDEEDKQATSSSNNHPHQQQQLKPAINPNTVTFSHFDSTFCSQYSESLKDKKVLMYCTGGIRCVKASAMVSFRQMRR
jgi:predicted sulfurtransferase